MESEKFELLFSLMKHIEHEKGSPLEKTIVGMINRFDKSMTDEQKRHVLNDFVEYERKKMRAGRSSESKTMIEEEARKSLLENFLIGYDISS